MQPLDANGNKGELTDSNKHSQNHVKSLEAGKLILLVIGPTNS